MGRWKPWRDLGEKYPDLDVVLCDFPIGPVRALYVCSAGVPMILVDRTLSPAERLAAVAHELVHHERGGGCGHVDVPEPMRPLVRREEEMVERLVADRLLPLGDLRAWCQRRAEDLEGVTAAEVVEEFEVAGHIAERQLRRLGERRSA